VEGTNKAHENGEAMGFVGVRLTVMLGHGYWFEALGFIDEVAIKARLGASPRILVRHIFRVV
jgi:hypothetical protein